MTQDFRQPGPQRIGPLSENPSPSEQGRRIVLKALLFTALASFCAGIWLLTQEQTVIPPESAPLVGGALVFVAISDVLAAQILRRIWSRGPGRAERNPLVSNASRGDRRL